MSNESPGEDSISPLPKKDEKLTAINKSPLIKRNLTLVNQSIDVTPQKKVKKLANNLRGSTNSALKNMSMSKSTSFYSKGPQPSTQAPDIHESISKLKKAQKTTTAEQR